MDRFFDTNNPVMQFLSRLVDLALLNIWTLLGALPVVTLGASMTAMNYVLLHLLRGDETYVTKMFWRSYKENLKQAILPGLFVWAVALITAVDLWVLHASDSPVMTLMMIVISVIAGFLLMTSVYMFALQSRYENTVRNTIVNAFKLSLGNLPRTAGMMAVWAAWILVLIYLNKAAPIAILLYGFSLPGFICTMLYNGVLKKLEPEQSET